MRNEPRVEATSKTALEQGLSDAERVEILCKLEGVSTRIASALLTVWNPNRYAVLDWVVWDLCRDWVGGGRDRDSTKSYEQFLGFCRSQSRALGGSWTPRNVEQAIYALGDDLD